MSLKIIDAWAKGKKIMSGAIAVGVVNLAAMWLGSKGISTEYYLESFNALAALLIGLFRQAQQDKRLLGE